MVVSFCSCFMSNHNYINETFKCHQRQTIWPLVSLWCSPTIDFGCVFIHLPNSVEVQIVHFSVVCLELHYSRFEHQEHKLKSYQKPVIGQKCMQLRRQHGNLSIYIFIMRLIEWKRWMRMRKRDRARERKRANRNDECMVVRIQRHTWTCIPGFCSRKRFELKSK